MSSGTFRLDIAETEPAPPPNEEPMQMSQEMSFEQRIDQRFDAIDSRLDAFESRLFTLECDVGTAINYLKAVAEHLGLRPKIERLNEQLDRIGNGGNERETIPGGE